MRKVFHCLENNKLVPRFLLIDENDEYLLSVRDWYVGSDGYLRRNEGHSVVYLHDLILPHSTDREVDHKNGNKLDCRRKNLRIVTRSQNNFYKETSVGITGFRGVRRRYNRYSARIKVGDDRIVLGYSDTAEEAYNTYKAACLFYFGELPRGVR